MARENLWGNDWNRLFCRRAGAIVAHDYLRHFGFVEEGTFAAGAICPGCFYSAFYLAVEESDRVGMSSYTYNSSNQLTSKPGVTYTYDSNGNTLTKVDSTGTTTYGWDFENRLISVTLPGTGGTVNFKYDPFGRRIQKTASVGSVNAIYVLDGADVLQEVNSTGSTIVARYTMGPGIDQPLAEARGSTTSFYEADGLGSVTSLSKSNGALANTYTYDSFGKQTASTGTVVNNFRYTARELDTETGLMYYRARYFDQALGRFISEDPAGFNASTNFFAYVGNSAPNYRDPIGLSRIGVFDCHCELAGPMQPTGHECLYHCECSDDYISRTVLFNMEGPLGLKKMCGAKLSCPKTLRATKVTYEAFPFGTTSLYGAYSGTF